MNLNITRQRKDLLLVALFACLFILSINFFAKLVVNTDKLHSTTRLSRYNQSFGITTLTPPLVSFDSQWYASIAKNGYTSTNQNHAYNIAFLPLYPLITRAVQTLLPVNVFTAGLLTAYTAYVAAMILLYKYAREVWKLDQRRSFTAVVAISVFPMGYIFTSMYAESLFLTLVLATFLLHHKKRFGLAAITAFLATATRINGLTLTVAFAIPIILNWKKRKPTSKQLWPALTPLIFLIAFAAYSYAIFDNPLQYIHAKQIWFSRQDITAPWETLATAWQYLTYALTNFNLTSVSMMLELPLIIIIALGTYRLWQKQHIKEAGYLLASLGLVLVSGTLWGLPRYTLALFPLFLLYLPAQKPAQAGWYAYITASTLLQALLIIQFTALTPPSP